ncbi:hypothetical protein ACM5Q9_11965 [Advenella sp. RU8]|uniref:hypothetical protein n=1 Tax=Advenella sp. RU8 TaxID=3399575 RepID=UPI003AAA3833
MTTILSKKLLSLIGAGLLILIAAIWFLGNNYATRTAEEEISATLAATPLANEIHWEKLSANILGTVTIENVTIGKRKPFLNIQKLQLSGFENSASRLQGQLVLTGVTDANGQSPLLENTLLQNAGYDKADPLNVSLDLDALKTKGTAEVRFNLDQREVIKIDSSFSISQAQQLMAVLSSGLENSKEAFSPMMMFSIGAMLEPININNTEIEIEDQGYMKKVNALTNQYNIPLLPSEKTLDTEKFAKEQQQANIEQAIQQCALPDPENQLFEKPVETCKAIAKFMFQESNKLTLKLKSFRLKELDKLAPNML